MIVLGKKESTDHKLGALRRGSLLTPYWRTQVDILGGPSGEVNEDVINFWKSSRKGEQEGRTCLRCGGKKRRRGLKHGCRERDLWLEKKRKRDCKLKGE